MHFIYFLGLQKNVSDCLLRRSAWIAWIAWIVYFTHRYILGKEGISFEFYEKMGVVALTFEEFELSS